MVATTSALLAWAVLAFGAVYTWAWSPLLLGAAATGASGVWLGLRRGTLPRGQAAAIAVLLAAVLLQLVPLPAPMLDSLSPSASRFLARYDVAFALSSADVSSAVTHPLSIDPATTSVGAVFIASLGLLFIGLSATLTARQARVLADTVLVLSLALALIGIVQARLSADRIYGFWQPIAVSEPFGPFVNRNHFAGWMLLAVPLCLGRFCERLTSTRCDSGRGWRPLLAWCGSAPAARLAMSACALGVMVLSLVMTLSRSAIVSLAFASSLLAVCVARREPRRLRGALVTAFVVVLPGFALAWTGFGAVVDRFTSTARVDLVERATAWRDALTVIRDFAVTGAGINTYPTASILYGSPTLTHYYSAAHSDYLQLAAEGGLLVGIPALAVIVAVVAALRTRLRQASSTHWLRIGAAMALVAIALQELVDFSLQIPANTVLLVVVAAIAVHHDTAPARAVNNS